MDERGAYIQSLILAYLWSVGLSLFRSLCQFFLLEKEEEDERGKKGLGRSNERGESIAF